MKIIKCPAFVFFLDIFLNNFLVGTRKCLLLNISVKKENVAPLSLPIAKCIVREKERKITLIL